MSESLDKRFVSYACLKYIKLVAVVLKRSHENEVKWHGRTVLRDNILVA